MKTLYKAFLVIALGMFSLQAQALIITTTTIGEVDCDYTDPGTTCWSDTVTTPDNPNAADVSAIVGVSNLVELYKAEVPNDLNGDILEEGSFASSYDTIFGPINNDPEDALISLLEGAASISCPECFLLVKDGNQDPTWYIFDIGSWDGLVLDIQDFWAITADNPQGNGAISHVSIFGNVANVPEPSMIGLLAIGLIGVVVTRRRMKV